MKNGSLSHRLGLNSDYFFKNLLQSKAPCRFPEPCSRWGRESSWSRASGRNGSLPAAAPRRQHVRGFQLPTAGAAATTDITAKPAETRHCPPRRGLPAQPPWHGPGPLPTLMAPQRCRPPPFPRRPRPQQAIPPPGAGPYQNPPVLLTGMGRVPVPVDCEPHGVGPLQPAVGEPHCEGGERPSDRAVPPTPRPRPAPPGPRLT